MIGVNDLKNQYTNKLGYRIRFPFISGNADCCENYKQNFVQINYLFYKHILRWILETYMFMGLSAARATAESRWILYARP